jgi:hypothetical protein
MPREHQRYQFSLRRLFIWVLALSVMLGLTRLPYPINLYFTLLYWAALFAYVGAQSVWLAALLGGLGGIVGLFVVIGLTEGLARPDDVAFRAVAIAVFCFSPGAYVGTVVGLLARERRNEQRLKARLAEVCKEVADRGVDDPKSE